MTILRTLRAGRCFAPYFPFGHDLAAIHVPFDELLGRPAYETRITQTALAGGVALVVGGTGEGKSALSSFALSLSHGFLPVPVPVSTPHPDGVQKAQIPSLVLSGLALVLAGFDERAAIIAERAAAGLRPRSREANVTFKAFNIELGHLLRGRRSERPWTTREERDAIAQAAAATRRFGLSPVLVFDDTDKWASSTNRLRAANDFFGDSLEALLALELPVVVHAHPHYFDQIPQPTYVDVIARVPRVDAAGIGAILDRRIRTTPGSDGSTVAKIFSDPALDALTEIYCSDTSVSLRRIIQIASGALFEADEAGLDQITVGAVENAVAVD